MPITVVCDQCGKQYQVPESRAGQKGKCSCGNQMVVPAAPSPQARTPMAPLAPSGSAAPAPRAPLGGPDSEPDGPMIGAAPRPPGQGPAVGLGSGVPPPAMAHGPALPHRPAAYASAAPERPLGLTIFLVLNFLWLGLITLVGVALLVGGGAIAAGMASKVGVPARAGAITGLVMGIGVGVLVVTALGILLAACLWKGANWARIVYIILTGLNILLGIAGLLMGGKAMPMGAPGPNPVLQITSLAVAGLFLWVLTREDTKEFCSQ